MGMRAWLREYDAEGVVLMATPILLVPLYVYFSDAWSRWWQLTDIAAVTVTLAIGIAGVWLLPASRPMRGAICLGYAAAVVLLSSMWVIAHRGGL